MANAFADRLAARGFVLLDGGLGTELERRGFEAPLPVWTADAAVRAPELLESIHREYLEAGCDVVSANTWRTSAYALRKVGREGEAQTLTRRSVELAQSACGAAGHGFIAGSLGPLEDCFQPERVPPATILRREHAEHAERVAACGVDLLLLETFNTAREAHAAAEAALATGLPVVASLILDARTGDVLSGEDLAVAAAHLRGLEVEGRRIAGLLVNCVPPDVALEALDRLETSQGNAVAIGAYANAGCYAADGTWSVEGGVAPADFAQWAVAARARGARVLGGCCGSTPAHLRAAAVALGLRPST